MRLADAMHPPNANPARRYPRDGDARIRSGALFPTFIPKFPLNFRGLKVFTIGSCFARNIEDTLEPLGAVLPTRAFSAPKTEWEWRSSALLNEYSPGAMSQRILFALQHRELPEETIVPSGTLYTDLLLPFGSDVTRERAIERRRQISQVYNHLDKCAVAVITLGLVETWFDEETKLFLNRMPVEYMTGSNSTRFQFRRLDLEECVSLLAPAIDALIQAGVKIVLTVSPVPLGRTFSGEDCILANEVSKSTLRVCAHRLCKRMQVDYFPAYEIVRSAGLQGYQNDHRHPKESLVRDITVYMVASYQATHEARASDPLPSSIHA